MTSAKRALKEWRRNRRQTLTLLASLPNPNSKSGLRLRVYGLDWWVAKPL